MIRSRLSLMLWPLMLALFHGEASAQNAHPCAALSDPVTRLACYDKAFPPVANAKTLLTEDERNAAAKRDFGFSRSQREANDPTGQPVAAGPSKVEAVVAEVENIDTGQRILKLEDGQVWLLTESTRRGFLKPGDRVEIRKALMGTFMVIAPGGLGLRAKRVH